MGKMSSLIVALLAIFSVFTTVQAEIKPNNISMVANAGQLSVAEAHFVDDDNIDEDGNHGQISMFLPAQLADEYSKLDCITAISITDPFKIRIKRAIVSRTFVNGFVRINNDMDFDLGNQLGNFATICSFLAPTTPIFPGTTMHASVNIGGRTGLFSVHRSALIRPKKSVVNFVEAYVSNTPSMNQPTAFRIQGIDRSRTPSNEFYIRNTEGVATSPAEISFLSGSGSPRVSCDGYWDGVLYKNSAIATVLDRAYGVHFALGSPLNTADEIILYCYDLYGYSTSHIPSIAPYLPAALQFNYDSIYRTFTIAITPTRPATDSFETGFTRISPFPHFTPKSVFV